MNKKQSAKGLGLQSDTETIKNINRAAAKKQRDTIKLNDDYRAYCKTLETTETPMAFIEFKSAWYKKRSDSNRKKFQKPRQNNLMDDKLLRRRYQSEYDKLCNKDQEYKKTISFKEFHRKKIDELLKERETQELTKNSKMTPTFWEKVDKDASYSGALKSREYGSLGKAWGSPRVYRKKP
jgi:hypothetical protein